MEQARQGEKIPEGFTLGLALMDAVPVALFCASAVLLGRRLDSPLFVAGALVSFAGGAGKVTWKLIIALARKNVGWLSRQMRFAMPVGFALMVAGIALSRDAAAGMLARLATFPSAVCMAVWVACMATMGYLAGHRDQEDARGNWLEEGVNSCGQAALLCALLLA